MNTRIRELARQAERLVKDELAHLERVHNRLYSFTEGRKIYNQKFAKLIVRECAYRIDYWESRQGEHSDDLLKHFGVI